MVFQGQSQFSMFAVTSSSTVFGAYAYFVKENKALSILCFMQRYRLWWD